MLTIVLISFVACILLFPRTAEANALKDFVQDISLVGEEQSLPSKIQETHTKINRGGGSSTIERDTVQEVHIPMKRKFVNIVFSDVDGTLVHYPAASGSVKENETGNRIIYLPASSTGLKGMISSKTLVLCQKLRRENHSKLVLVSGMRTSTLLTRLPYLPKADAYASEAGGRIFYLVDNPDPTDAVITPVYFDGASEDDLKSFGLVEDESWRNKISNNGAGSDGYVGDAMDVFLGKCDQASPIELSQRRGQLWEFGKMLEQKGFIVDYKGYSNCFRVNLKQQTKISREDFHELESTDVSYMGLATSCNLGCIDFYPKSSGKKNCCAFLARHFQEQTISMNDEELLKSCVCLCDDDNDLEMAHACGKVYLPALTSDSMRDAVKNNRHRFFVTENVFENVTKTRATECALAQVVQEMSNPLADL